MTGVSQTCERRPLSFSSRLLPAFVTLSDGELSLSESTIVVNAGTQITGVRGWRREAMLPMTSSQLQNVTLDATANLLLFEHQPAVPAKVICHDLGWQRFSVNDTPINLWRSPQDVIGEVSMEVSNLTDPDVAANAASSNRQRFNISVNLWFAPQGTDCLIHREHTFIEIHSQIMGVGHMQKFHARENASLYEDIALAPGATTERPFCLLNQHGVPIYPWHQYYAETDCIWLAVEYHPVTEVDHHA